MKLSKKTAIEILNAGLTTGADYAEIYYQDNLTNSYVRRFKKVYSVSGGKTCGVGIRLLKGVKQVYGYTADLSKKALLELAKELALGFDGKQELEVTSLKEKKHKNLIPVEIPHSSWTTEEKLSYLEEGEKAAYAVSEKVQDVMTRLMEEDEHVEIYNSDGEIHQDNRCRTRIMVLAVASDGKQFQQDFAGPGLSKGLEFLNETDFKTLCKETAETAVALLDAPEGPSGEMPVVLGNNFGGVLFHEACGHPLEASAVSKNLSVFSGKIGQQIASPILSAIDDGTIPNGWGSNNIDDEGNKTEKTLLIENGILKDYLIDDFNGRRMNRKGNGACRRQSYKYEPTSRMSNTYICAGKSTPEEIIAATKFGLYAKSLAGGQVNPVTGEFNFGCSEAYLIRDGKICEPVRGASVIGTGQEILMKIDMIGNDLERAQGMCGAASGFIPVDVGQPTIRVSEMTVGGNGGEIK